ncbi:MAG TPA: hypothetical protein VEX63_11165, partial [Flavisolibacter sp.]|nr:hypothetical protein [Flavisolibacter sp.]
MEHLLFATYLILFAWLITRIRFFRNSGLSPAQLIIVFLLKVMAGIFYGWIGVYYGEMARMVDTWVHHYSGLKEYEVLLNNPALFFSEVFQTPYESGFSKFLTSKDSWWNDIKYVSFVKMLGIFNLFSFGNYYINIILYSFLTLFGPIAVYKMMKHAFATEGILLFIIAFFIPSFLYWTSGLHKDGLMFTAIALIIYELYFWLAGEKFSLQKTLIILFGIGIILLLRGFLIGILIPVLLAWIICAKSKKRPLLILATVYLIFIILFFSAKYIHPKLDFPQAVAQRQSEFAKLKGGSEVNVESLQPNLKGFISNFPQAVDLSLIRPHFSDAKHLLSLTASIEIHLILLLIVIMLLFRRKDFELSPFILFCFSFVMFICLMTGYTVNFLGAIVRYRAIALPFLVIPVVMMTDWKVLVRRFSKSHI